MRYDSMYCALANVHFYNSGFFDENQELYYSAICRAIAPNYDGYVGQEFTPKGDAVAALQQAYDPCNV